MTTSSKQYRVGMIGAGAIVQRGHIPNFQAVPNAEVVAVCDVNLARAQEAAQATGVPAAYSDYKEMLSKEGLDIVVVAVPNIFHKPMTIDALRAGANVLCEKPLALSSADALEMYGVADEVGKQLAVGTHYRYSNPVQSAKQQVDAGFFGDIYAARTLWNRRAGIPGYGSWFTNNDLAGGGSLFDIGIHAMDRALYLMGYPEPVSVSGASYAKFGPRGMGLGGWGMDKQKPTPGARFDVDDFAWGFIRFANGATLMLEVSWAAHFEEQFYTEIYGTEGGAYIGSEDRMELYTNLNGQPVNIPVAVPKGGNSYGRFALDYVRQLDGEQTDIVTREQALISVKIIEGIQKSAASGKESHIA
jgi:predicted dehydrogenase